MLSKRNKEVLFNPLSKDNPVLVQILGICSTLAVTVKLEPAIVMGLSVITVLAFSNVIISLIRKTIPTTIRIIVQLVVVAALVIVVQQFLVAYDYDVSLQLNVFIGLIITNCILILGHRGILPRTAGQRHAAGLPGDSAVVLRSWLHGQRHDDFAADGSDYRGLHHMGAARTQ